MAATHSGFFVQSNYGTVGNFEVVAPRIGGGLDHFWRDNDDATAPWIGPRICFGSTNDPNDGSLIQSNFGANGNLEVVFIDRARLFLFFRDYVAPQLWQGGWELPGTYRAVGRPALIQSTFGTVGNFEVVAALATGGMAHWWRDNDQSTYPWTMLATFATNINVDAVALLQSNYGVNGKNLEVVALSGGQLHHYSRADTTPFAWSFQSTFASSVTGSPGFIQSNYGTVGNYEVVAPVSGGGMAHWWRDNDAPTTPWNGPSYFGTGTIESVSLIQSNYGNLEVIARNGRMVEHYYRDSTTLQWHKTATLPQVTCVPSTAGQCRIPWRGLTVGTHNGMCHTNEVVLFGFQFNNSGSGESSTLNPFTGLTTLSTNIDNHFCSGHAFLPDGRLMVAGGHAAHVDALTIYNPVTRTWLPHIHMSAGRWYPTCTTLDTGNIFIISGTIQGGRIGPPGIYVNNTWEIRDASLTQLATQTIPTPFSIHFPTVLIPGWGTLDTIDLYPFVYVIPKGNGILSGQLFIFSRNTARFLAYRTNVWDARQIRTVSTISRSYPGEGTSVLLPLRPTGSIDNPSYPAKVLVAGGAGLDTFPSSGLSQSTPATNTAEIIDLSVANPTWRNTNQAMNYPRVMPDSVLLPDGNVLIVSGSITGAADVGIDPVLQIELFDPTPETFTELCTMNVPRLYHASAVLLPDATVLIAGKDGDFNAVPYKYPEYRTEIFSPPYLFRGPRPSFGGWGGGVLMDYNVDFHIPTPSADDIESVVLIRQGSCTHSFNMDQRLVGLWIDSVSSSPPGLIVRTPFDRTVAPPGFYMLFLVNSLGVPSVSVWVHLV